MRFRARCRTACLCADRVLVVIRHLPISYFSPLYNLRAALSECSRMDRQRLGPGLAKTGGKDSAIEEVRMEHEKDKVVRDADEVVRDYYEGDETALEGEFRDIDDTAPVGDARGHDRTKYTARTPALTGGDVDAGWEYADIGEETVGGSNPTPDQDIVDQLGQAVGVTYQDNEPLKFGDKLEERDRSRWELDPASSDDYQERQSSEDLK